MPTLVHLLDLGKDKSIFFIDNLNIVVFLVFREVDRYLSSLNLWGSFISFLDENHSRRLAICLILLLISLLLLGNEKYLYKSGGSVSEEQLGTSIKFSPVNILLAELYTMPILKYCFIQLSRKHSFTIFVFPKSYSGNFNLSMTISFINQSYLHQLFCFSSIAIHAFRDFLIVPSSH